MATDGNVFSMALWTVKEGMEGEFIDTWKTFAGWTNSNQKGAMGAYLTRDQRRPLRFVSFGYWSDVDSLNEWRDTDDFKDFFALAKDLCTDVQPMTMDIVTMVGKVQMVAGIEQ